MPIAETCPVCVHWPMLEDGSVVHANVHVGDLGASRGPDARRRTLRLMARITRHQRDREAHELGYRVLGEGG